MKAYKKESPKPFSRVRAETDRPFAFAIQCRHCENPPCVAACLSGAMQIDRESGLVVHSEEKCMGCYTCIMVCPYGAIKADTAKNRVVAKCDLCPDLEVAACVANCPNEALVYKEVSNDV